MTPGSVKRYLATWHRYVDVLAGAIFYRYELAGQQAPFALQDRYGALEAIFE